MGAPRYTDHFIAQRSIFIVPIKFLVPNNGKQAETLAD
jgi:hypothetical protein